MRMSVEMVTKFAVFEQLFSWVLVELLQILWLLLRCFKHAFVVWFELIFTGKYLVYEKDLDTKYHGQHFCAGSSAFVVIMGGLCRLTCKRLCIYKSFEVSFIIHCSNYTTSNWKNSILCSFQTSCEQRVEYGVLEKVLIILPTELLAVVAWRLIPWHCLCGQSRSLLTVEIGNLGNSGRSDAAIESVVIIATMAAEVLNDVICRRISVDDLITWLTTDQMVIVAEENVILVGIIWSQ